MKIVVLVVMFAALIGAACAPAAQPAAAPAAQPAAPAAPKAPAQPQAPAPAAAAVQPQLPAPAAVPKAEEPKEAAAKPKYGGRVIVPHGSDWPHFDPHLNISNTTQWRASLHYLRLVTKEPRKDVYDVHIVPDAAERWDISADALEYTFYLRKGMKWARVEPLNARELTSDDVVYSFERALSPVNVARGKYAALKKVEALDKYTVKFTLRQKDSRFLDVLTHDPSWIVPKEMIEKHGDLKNVGAGAGPFILDKADKSIGTFHKKNPDYYDANKVYLDYHDIPLIPDKATALAAFRAGKVDILGTWGIGVNKQELEGLLKTNPETQWVGMIRPSVGSQLWLRFGTEPFNDLKVRKALNHAINRDAMLKALYQGQGQYQGYVASAYPGFVLAQDELKLYLKYDPALSRKLLAEAGYPKGFKTNVMWNKSGSSSAVELYQQFFKDVGVELDLQAQAVDYPKWVTDVYQGNFPQLGAAGGIVEGALTTIYAFNHTKGERNGPKSSVPKIDELIDKAIATLDVKEQEKLVKEAQRVLLTEVLWNLPCCETPSYDAWQPWVNNYRTYSTGIYTRDMYWYVWLNK